MADHAEHAPIDIISSHQNNRACVTGSDFKLETPGQPADTPPTEIDPDEKYNRDVPPDGGYGWVCVACVFWINACTWGINSVSDHSTVPRGEADPRTSGKFLTIHRLT